MSLGAASSSIEASISSVPSYESSNDNNHGPIKLRMDDNDPYIGFEEFPNLECPTHQVGGELATLLEEEKEEQEDEEEEEAGDEEQQEEDQQGGKLEKEEIVVWDKCRPYVGMEFRTSDEAYNFYNSYGGHAGFSIRKNSQTKSRNGVSSMRFVCSKEGFSKRQRPEQKGLESSSKLKTLEREYGTTRADCKACLRIKLVKGVWQVTIFRDDNNHDLIHTPSKKRNLRSHKYINAEDKEIILQLSAQNVGTSQILEYIAEKLCTQL